MNGQQMNHPVTSVVQLVFCTFAARHHPLTDPYFDGLLDGGTMPFMRR